MYKLIFLIATTALLHGCAAPGPGPGPFGRVIDDVKEGLRKTGEDLGTVAKEIQDSTDPDKARGVSLRVLVIPEGIISDGANGVLNDLERNLEQRGFEIIGEDEVVSPLSRYRRGGAGITRRNALSQLAFSLPAQSFGALVVTMNSYKINRKGSLSHGSISGTAKFKVSFRFAADPVHLHPDDMDREYWRRSLTVERDINERQVSFLEDQILQDLDAREDPTVRTPQLRAAYLSEVLAEAFDRVVGTMPRPHTP